MSERLKGLISWMAEWQGVVEIFLVVLAVAVFNYILHRSLERLAKRASETESPWDDALFLSMDAPARLLAWVLGLSFAAQIGAREAEFALLDVIDPARDLAVVACVTWFLFRFIRHVEANFLARADADPEARLDRTTTDALAKLLKASVAITGTLVAMQALGINITGVIAFGGIGGIAVGFAARDVLANFFGGMTVYLDRQFAVGDWIRSPDRNIEGTVEHIGWRSTRIRTFDKRPLYVPNAVFTTVAVENPSRMENRRIYETVGVRYDDVAVLPAILRDVREMVDSHPEIDQDKTKMIFFDSFGASSMDFFIYCFTRTVVWPEFHAVKEDVLMKVADIITEHGAEVAFPTRTLHLPEGIVTRAEKEAGEGG